jgi:hypothetical protein
MSNVKSYLGTARVEDQHPDVFPGSPMALVGLFAAALQSRFSDDNIHEDSPYVWMPDAQQPEETDDSANGTRIYIESQYTEEPDARDRMPALLVEKGATRLEKITLGHRSSVWLPTMTEVFTAWATVPMSVLCIAPSRGTSATLADVVFAFVSGSANALRASFCIHDISPPTIGETSPYRENSNKVETWNTPVTFTTMIKYQWKTTPIAPRLNAIGMHFRETGRVLDVSQTLRRNPRTP